MLMRLFKMCILPVLSEIGTAVFIVLLCFILMLLGPFISPKSPETVILMYLLFVVLVGMGIVTVVCFAMLHLVSVLIANNSLRKIPGFSQERLEREIKKTPRFNKLYAWSDAIVYMDQYNIIHTIALDEIIWAYCSPGELGLGLKNGKKVTIYVLEKKSLMNKGATIRYLLRLIARKNKGVVIGYDDSLEKKFKNDFELFLSESAGIEVVDSALLEQEYIENNYYEKDFC